jgi:Heparinase II/III-like protein/Domain of unknown function (DUF4962)
VAYLPLTGDPLMTLLRLNADAGIETKRPLFRTKFVIALPFLLLWLIGNSPAFAQRHQEFVPTIRTEHPRLILTRVDWENLRESIKSDPLKSSWLDQIRRAAETQIQRPRTKYKLGTDGLLFQSREALTQLSTFGALYRLTGEKRYAEVARQELLTVIGFPDWNPPHFLDTAEMTAAVALGYDWIYDALSTTDREAIEAAIVHLGLEPGLRAYDKPAWWVQNPNNWNIVCHGGLVLGALAIAELAPDLAERTLAHALQDVPYAIRTFGPDGAWPEGFSYWAYSTQYSVMLIASLRSALGNDFGLMSIPGLSRAGFFPIYETGPSGLTFNFADAEPEARAESAPQMFWLAQAFHEPDFAAFELSRVTAGNLSIWHLLYMGQNSGQKPQGSLPLFTTFHGVQDVGVARSSWDDASAAWVALKGGDNKAGHSHLDLGSFVYEVEGERWAVDPGRDSHSLPGYFGKERYQYFRTSTRGHNALIVDGGNQPLDARAAIIESGKDNGGSYFFTVDLSSVYGIGHTKRRIELLSNHNLRITDDIEAKTPRDVLWNMLTNANIDNQGSVAILSQNGKTITVRILSPSDAKFEVLPGAGPPPEAQSPSLKRLSVALAPLKKTHLVLELGNAPAQ